MGFRGTVRKPMIIDSLLFYNTGHVLRLPVAFCTYDTKLSNRSIVILTHA